MNPKRERFVAEYLVDLNATQAAIRAGYSPRSASTTAERLLTNAEVQLAIQEGQRVIQVRTEVEQDRVVQELAYLAFSDIREVAKWDADNVDFLDSDDIPDHAARAVREIGQTRTQHGGSMRLRLHDKVTALKLLGQHVGMFMENGAPSPEQHLHVPADWSVEDVLRLRNELRAREGTIE